MNKNKLKKEQRKYLRSIKHSLPIAHRKCAKLMKKLSRGLSEYCTECEPQTMDALYDEFGTVEEVTESILSEIPPEQIIKNSKRRKYCTYIIIAILAGALALTVKKLESELKTLPGGWDPTAKAKR